MRNEARANELNELFDAWARLMPNGPFYGKDTFRCPKFMPGQQHLATKSEELVEFTLYRGTQRIGSTDVPCTIIGAEGLVVAACIVFHGVVKPYFAFDGLPLPNELLSA